MDGKKQLEDCLDLLRSRRHDPFGLCVHCRYDKEWHSLLYRLRFAVDGQRPNSSKARPFENLKGFLRLDVLPCFPGSIKDRPSALAGLRRLSDKLRTLVYPQLISAPLSAEDWLVRIRLLEHYHEYQRLTKMNMPDVACPILNSLFDQLNYDSRIFPAYVDETSLRCYRMQSAICASLLASRILFISLNRKNLVNSLEGKSARDIMHDSGLNLSEADICKTLRPGFMPIKCRFHIQVAPLFPAAPQNVTKQAEEVRQAEEVEHLVDVLLDICSFPLGATEREKSVLKAHFLRRLSAMNNLPSLPCPWCMAFQWGNGEIIFEYVTTSSPPLLEEKDKTFRKLYYTTDKEITNFMPTSLRERLDEVNSDLVGILAHFDNEKECKLYSTRMKKTGILFIGYTDTTKASLFSVIDSEFSSPKNQASNPFARPILDYLASTNDFEDIATSLAKTLYYPPKTLHPIECDDDDFAGRATNMGRERVNNLTKEQVELNIEFILNFAKRPKKKADPQTRSLLDLLAVKFVGEHDQPPMPEHFRHPTMTKKKGGKRVPRSWFTLQNPDEHRTWNVAVITELVKAVYKLQHDGVETAEEELWLAMRNTRDRLLGLEEKYDVRKNEEPSEKSSEAKQKKTRGSIPLRAFVAALFPPTSPKAKTTQDQAASDDTTG